ncbi:MAG TPA: EAL domain-containing protein [Bacillota bacterium]|nr:EAL domain-containing protein [Bacillota bacterium]
MLKVLGRIPNGIWFFIFLSYILPFLFGGLFSDQGVERLRWVLFIVPSFFFSYYFGLRGGFLSSLCSNIILVLWEWRRMIQIAGFEESWPLYIVPMIVILNFTVAVCMGILSRKRASSQLVHHSLQNDDREKAWIEQELSKAIEQEDFVVYYQPRIDLINRKIVGMEALVRWQHPERGILPPLSFIPVAEETEQIIPLGEWVLREACKQTKNWAMKGQQLNVSVNVSGVQFRNELVDLVRQILQETGLDPCLLELEITESLLIKNIEEAIKICNELKKLGIKLSLDDFGTGYSSLSYLKSLPIDCLKIDQSFIRDMKRDMPIIAAVIQLGNSLNLSVVAEGVESEEQATILMGINCDHAQGYLFSPPIPPEEFERLYLANE